MLAIAPAFRVIDMNVNHRKRHWVQYGNETCDTLREWVLEHFLDFRVMTITRVAKYLCAMMGPEGSFIVGPRNTLIRACSKINESLKSLVEPPSFRTWDFKYLNHTCNSLRGWVLANCLEFREMKISRVAKNIGAMIEPEGYLHRWAAPCNFVSVCSKSNDPPMGSVARLVDYKMYALLVLGFVGSFSGSR